MATKSNKAYSYLRFSTPDQIKGDSFRRQTELSRKYAEENGLDLDEELTFQDLGVSAFRGDNIQEGQLGAFLDAVDRGKVPPGSTLLVESLDRLSRQSPYVAFRHLDDILHKGVRVVTLQDRRVYDAEQGELAFADLMMSLIVMQRAHEESVTKSSRGREAWKAKRDAAISGGRKLTSICPNWLVLDKDRQEFEVIEERAAVVRRIFSMTIDGIGNRALAARLNEERVPPFGRAAGWTHDYVRRILENEAVVGRYQPHKRMEVSGKRKRVPVGDPIEEYFPVVVPPEVFMKAQRVRRGRKIPGGRIAQRYSNLFTGLVRCGVCGAPMHFENKGKLPRGGSYLVCSHARTKLGCSRHSWRYPQAQTHILMNFNELDFREMFPGMFRSSEVAASRMEDAVLVKEGELERVRERLGRLTEALLDRGSSPTLLAKLDELEQEEQRIGSALDHLKQELMEEQDRLASAATDYNDIDTALTKYIQIERDGDDGAILDARRRLHQMLKRVIASIILTPSDGEDGLHGTIKILFQGVEEYHRLIKVEKGQDNSQGFKVRGDEEHRDVTVVDARWPPHGRLMGFRFVMEQMLRGS